VKERLKCRKTEDGAGLVRASGEGMGK